MPRCVQCGKYIFEGEAFWIPIPESKYPWGIGRDTKPYLKYKFWNPCPCFCTHCSDFHSAIQSYMNAVTSAKRSWLLTTEYKQNPVIEEYWLNNV
jgi:hypothetical protein